MAEKKSSAEFRREVRRCLAKSLGMRCNFDTLPTGLVQLREAVAAFEEATKDAKEDRELLAVLEALTTTSNLLSPTETQPGKKLGQMFGAAYVELQK